MSKRQLPVVPFVEAARVGGKQKPTAISIMLSDTTSEKGSALGVAQYHHRPNGPMISFHYIVDNAMVYQCVRNNVAAYGNPHNAINILICARPHEQEDLWEDASARPVLHKAASLVADLMLVYNIKPRYLEDKALEKWLRHKWRRRGGLMIRVPGTWPYESFLLDVKSQMLVKDAGLSIPEWRSRT
jgi:hypothetical protein